MAASTHAGQVLSVSVAATNDYNPASASVTIDVLRQATTTALVASAPAATPGQLVTFTATVLGTATAPAGPTGTVRFQVNGQNYGSPVPLSSGTASVSIPWTAAGSDVITAIYSGDGNYSAASHTNGTSECFTVAAAAGRADVSVKKKATNSVPVGGAIRDSAAGVLVPQRLPLSRQSEDSKNACCVGYEWSPT